MATPQTIVHLKADLFAEKERTLVEHRTLTASAFRFESGVCGIRLRNEAGELVVLPFQGQQIWSAKFSGRNLTMKSMFTEPRPTQQYLETYGGFLLHCGATAMGVPTGDDTHPLHGELPNATYQEAYIVAGEDEEGGYLGLGGEYHHIVAFSHNYTARPLVKLHADSTLFRSSMTITNLKQSEMEWMYLAHINFRPVDNGRLVYSAPCDPQHVRVRKSVPTHCTVRPGYREFLAELEADPARHNVMDPDLLFDPEVVFFIDYVADADGWAHTMQVHPDGTADYVRHRPDVLDTGIRWICRTADQDAMGMILPATAEPEGYHAEKAKGNIKVLPPQGEVDFEMVMGTLDRGEAKVMEGTVAALLG